MSRLAGLAVLAGCTGYQLQPSVKTVRFMPERAGVEPTNGVAVEFELVPPMRLAEDQLARFERVLSWVPPDSPGPVVVVTPEQTEPTAAQWWALWEHLTPEQALVGAVVVVAVAFLAWAGLAGRLPVVGKWFGKRKDKPKR